MTFPDAIQDRRCSCTVALIAVTNLPDAETKHDCHALRLTKPKRQELYIHPGHNMRPSCKQGHIIRCVPFPAAARETILANEGVLSVHKSMKLARLVELN